MYVITVPWSFLFTFDSESENESVLEALGSTAHGPPTTGLGLRSAVWSHLSVSTDSHPTGRNEKRVFVFSCVGALIILCDLSVSSFQRASTVSVDSLLSESHIKQLKQEEFLSLIYSNSLMVCLGLWNISREEIDKELTIFEISICEISYSGVYLVSNVICEGSHSSFLLLWHES